MKRSAFTLIELLVVIAIIAILAAILFPVFAQAKAAAKGAVSLSNAKQQGLAVMMYTSDADDTAVLDTAWGGGYPIWYGSAGSDFAPWSYLIQPYMKNVGILVDPMGPAAANLPAGWPSSYANIWSAYTNLSYGYDYTVWSPTYFGDTDANGNMTRHPISMTSAARPADTVLLTAHTGNGENGDGWWYGIGTIETNYGSEAVDCNDIAPACFENWGTNAGFANASGMTVYEQGAITGLNAPRRAHTIVTTFGDGHAKAMQDGALAAGTNWSRTTDASTIVINNMSLYHWTNQ